MAIPINAGSAGANPASLIETESLTLKLERLSENMVFETFALTEENMIASKVTIDGMPLLHLAKPVHMQSLSYCEHYYLLVNNDRDGYLGKTDPTPIVGYDMADTESMFMSDVILEHLSHPTTRAIPIKKSHRNNEQDIMIGRSDDCDIVLSPKEMSKVHAKIICDDETGRFFLQDLKSKNGTFLQFEKLNGDKVRVWSRSIISFAGKIPAALIGPTDLQMLLAMLPQRWENSCAQTETSQFKIMPR